MGCLISCASEAVNWIIVFTANASKVSLQLLGTFTILNIVYHSIPLNDCSSFVAHRYRTRLEPVEMSVRAATQSRLILQRITGTQHILPRFENLAEIFGMNYNLPTPP